MEISNAWLGRQALLISKWYQKTVVLSHYFWVLRNRFDEWLSSLIVQYE
ncbi:hypothetical protein SAMN05216167_101506 [Spirosoma endophyticum]|uniref:Uncharacterized protein n=1 Tax=Spirosoma endophyticum TaxID=662367 RepID=A0A1I1GKY1_9BACT|nr:hypothetical protein SAMN05216167_101506 [Spirosoma endophyticum]